VLGGRAKLSALLEKLGEEQRFVAPAARVGFHA